MREEYTLCIARSCPRCVLLQYYYHSP